ncbi:MAG TPA: hypothetical protein VKN62_10140 [Pelovirga sp.]|nr:hypothetical protein [Pelovirga sp.]
MNETQKKFPSQEGQLLLNTLQKAVADALEKKRRLGQYAVVWRDGKPTILGKESSENISLH